MKESRNQDFLIINNPTSGRLNAESKEPKEDISDKKEDNKENIVDIPDKKEDNKENKTDVKGKKEASSNKVFKSKFYNNEVIPLLKTKKAKLQNKFKSLYDKFDKLGDKPIYDIIEKYSEEKNGNSSAEDLIEIDQGNLEKIKEKKRIYLEKRKCKIYTLAFLFLTFYLVGIFQLLDLFDATKKITGIIFKLFFSNKSNENKETFKDL